MELSKLQADLDRIFDQAVLHHGFTNYMRDYEVNVYCTAALDSGVSRQHLRYLFKACVVADVETALDEATWSRSLDDRLIDWESGKDLNGFVWGVKWADLYPGTLIVEDSARARKWAKALDRDFHEVRFETNVQHITLVFSELEVSSRVVG